MAWHWPGFPHLFLVFTLLKIRQTHKTWPHAERELFSTPVHQTRSEPVISTALNYTWACSWPGPAPAMRLIAQPWGYPLSGLLLAGLVARSPQTRFCLVFAKGEWHRQRAKKLSRQLRTWTRCDMSPQGILGPCPWGQGPLRASVLCQLCFCPSFL